MIQSHYIIQTERLGLRTWYPDDLELLTALNADPEVMEHFPGTLDRSQSLDFLGKMNEHFEKYGHCYWAVDRLDTGNFIGFIGLKYQDFVSEFTPCVDIGWRLMRQEWGQGFAPEGASACLTYGFKQLGLKKIFSFCPEVNKNSERVMVKIGMQRLSTFNHPLLPSESPLLSCVAYVAE